MWYVAMPDRRRGPRGGHHTGSLPELSRLTPPDLVLYGAGNRHKSTCQWKWASAGLALPVPGHRQARHTGRLPAHRHARPQGGQALFPQNAEGAALARARPDRHRRGGPYPPAITIMLSFCHVGREVQAHYRWHALYGRRVRREYVERRAGGEVVHIEVAPGVVFAIAAWMLDAAACAGAAAGDNRGPR